MIMKRFAIIGFFLVLIGFKDLRAQVVNWKNIYEKHRNMVNINTGLDFGFTYGLGYNRLFLVNKNPLLLGVEYSMPSGGNLIDDFKVKIGGQIQVLNFNSFRVSTRIQGIFRRGQTPAVTLLNFGSDISLAAGYYRPRFFIAGETGFDKAIISHFKHNKYYKDNIYAEVKDGWYEPSTGGNFYYGLQLGTSFKQKQDITLRLGKVVTQDFKTPPMLPFYFQLGYNLRFE